MSLPQNVKCLLELHRLLAIVVNDCWAVIRRRDYVDLFIQNQPINSVEILFNTVTKRTIVRLWGKTVYDRECSDLAEEIKRAFFYKPCLGIPGLRGDNILGDIEVVSHEMPLRRYSSKSCTIWSAEVQKVRDETLAPAICNSCEKIPDRSTEWKLSGSRCKSRISIPESELKVETKRIEEFAREDYDVESGNKEQDFGNLYNLAHSLFQPDKIKSEEMEEDIKPLPPVAIQRDIGGPLKLVDVAEATLEQEYKGASPPFNERDIWMKTMFPDDYNHCIFCQAGFKNMEYMWHHLQFEHAFDWYMCPGCMVWRNRPEDILSHCNNYHSGKQFEFKCACCGKKFSGSEFEEHVNTCFEARYSYGDLSQYGLTMKHLKEKIKAKEVKVASFECNFCEEKFITRRSSIHHKMRAHSDLFSGYPCSDCNENFPKRRSLYKHINRVHKNIEYSCLQCDKTFPLKDGLRQHVMKVHQNEGRKRQCEICHNWYADREKLESHIRCKHTGEKPFKCNFCDMKFSQHGKKSLHRSQVHPDSWKAEKKRIEWLQENKRRDPSEFKIKCELCEEIRSTTEELQVHWQEEHPGQMDVPIPNPRRPGQTDNGTPTWKQKINCEICGETIVQRGMKFHMSYSHPESYQGVLSCDICGKGMSSRNSLEKHKLAKHTPGGKEQLKRMMQHTQSVCDVCGYVGDMRDMKRHMRIHDMNIRPKECNYCGKDCVTYAKMTCHRRVAHRDQWKADKRRLMREEGSIYLDRPHPGVKYGLERTTYYRNKKKMKDAQAHNKAKGIDIDGTANEATADEVASNELLRAANETSAK